MADSPFTPTLTTALDRLQAKFTDPNNAPRTDLELVQALQQVAQDGNPTSATKVFVADIESPTTPGTYDEQIRTQFAPYETEVRALSLRAKTVASDLASLVAENTGLITGLQSLVTAAAAQAAQVSTLTASSSLAWMSSVDLFLDSTQIDTNSSSGINLPNGSGCGIQLAPAQNQDLSNAVQTLSITANRSPFGVPGNNMELASIQSTPWAGSPATDGSSVQAAQSATANGGSGLEPTVSFQGVPDLRADLSTVLQSSPTTWFEWEALYVPPVQSCLQEGTAYVAQNGSGQSTNLQEVTDNFGWTATLQEPDGSQQTVALVQFMGDPSNGTNTNTTLILPLELDFGQPTPLTELDITLLQSNGLWPTIQSVSISLDHTTWYLMSTQGGSTTWQGDTSATSALTSAIAAGGASVPAQNTSGSGLSIWQLPSYATEDTSGVIPSFQYISIVFAQPKAYACPKGIGHPYYVTVVQTNKSSNALFGLIHSSSSSTNTTRYATPVPLIDLPVGSGTTSTSSPGAALGAILGAVASVLPTKVLGSGLTNAAKGAGGVAGVVSGIVTGLIGSSTKTTTVLQSGEYDDVFAGFRQCIAIQTIQPLARSYTIGGTGQLVTEPIGFNQPFSAVRLLVDQRVPDSTSITYDISTDNGNTWTTVQPLDMGQPPSPTLSNYQLTAIELGGPQTSCILRATLTTQLAHVTPSLLSYELQALPTTA